MGEDPDAPNYDPERKLIRSMINGSRGPMLRKATALDWAGDPFDATGFVALHGESTYAQFLEHYQEYTDVVGDHFLNLVATTLPTDAYLLTGEAKYRHWIVDYMDAWLERMRQNGGIIPSFVDLDGTIGGPEGKWWGNAYGWGFSPVNPVTGRREDRNRIPRALVGFSNALLVTGDQKYVDAWRTMIGAVNAHARVTSTDGRNTPRCSARRVVWLAAGALECGRARGLVLVDAPDDRARVGTDPWVEFLDGRNPGYPETSLQRDLESIARKIATSVPTRPRRTSGSPTTCSTPIRRPPTRMVRLMFGALVPSREGGLLNARLRYFDPDRRRAGVPEDVAALVSGLADRATTVTLVNVSRTRARTVWSRRARMASTKSSRSKRTGGRRR